MQLRMSCIKVEFGPCCFHGCADQPIYALIPRRIWFRPAARGWRGERGEPSLADMFGSVRTARADRSGASCWPSWVPAISSPSATWTPATGRPRSPAAPSSATRCLPSRCSSNLMAIILQSLCTRLGVGAGRDLAQACRDSFPRWVALPLVAVGGDRDHRDRSCRSDRHRDRAQSAVSHSARDRRHHHGARRLPDPGTAGLRLPLDRGLCGGDAGRDRGLFRGADRAGRSRLGRGAPRASRRAAICSPIARCSISRSAFSARP